MIDFILSLCITIINHPQINRKSHHHFFLGGFHSNFNLGGFHSHGATAIAGWFMEKCHL